MQSPLSEKFSSSINTLPRQSSSFVKTAADQPGSPQKQRIAALETSAFPRAGARQLCGEQENGTIADRADTKSEEEEQDAAIGAASFESSRSTSSMAVVRQRQSPRKVSSPEKRFPIKTSTLASFSENTYPKKSVALARTLSKSSVGQSRIEDGGGLPNVAEQTQDIWEFADETTFSTFSIVSDGAILSDFKQNGIDTELSGPASQCENDVKMYTGWEEITSADKDLSDGRTAQASDRLALLGLVDDRNNADPTAGEPQTSAFQRDQTQVPKASPGPPSSNNEIESHSRLTRRAHLCSSAEDQPHNLDPGTTCRLELHQRRKSAIIRGDLRNADSLFLSQISNLQTNVEEKQAEVRTLRLVIGEAERKAKDALREIQERNSLNEKLLIEKEHWNRKSREMEQQMHDIKEAMLKIEREKFQLLGRLEESEQRREAAEIMAQDAESKAAGLRLSCTKTSDSKLNDDKKDSNSANNAIQVAVEKVARDLHLLYKNKHESKVAALKRSYEGRWEKKVEDLEARVTCLIRANEELKTHTSDTSSVIGLDRYESTVEKTMSVSAEETSGRTTIKAGLDSSLEMLECLRHDNAELRKQLDLERVEKGELVMACDELLALQDRVPAQPPSPSLGGENRKANITRTSGLRMPELSSANQHGVNGLSVSRISRLERVRYPCS